jgi:hypothetical protein
VIADGGDAGGARHDGADHVKGDVLEPIVGTRFGRNLRTKLNQDPILRSRCKFYNATESLASFENKNILFYFKNALANYIQCWRCCCKLKSVGLAPAVLIESRDMDF